MSMLLIRSVILFFMVGNVFLFGVNVWVGLFINVFCGFGLGFFVEVGCLLLFVSSVLFKVDFASRVFLFRFLFFIDVSSFFLLLEYRIRFFFKFWRVFVWSFEFLASCVIEVWRFRRIFVMFGLFCFFFSFEGFEESVELFVVFWVLSFILMFILVLK